LVGKTAFVFTAVFYTVVQIRIGRKAKHCPVYASNFFILENESVTLRPGLVVKNNVPMILKYKVLDAERTYLWCVARFIKPNAQMLRIRQRDRFVRTSNNRGPGYATKTNQTQECQRCADQQAAKNPIACKTLAKSDDAFHGVSPRNSVFLHNHYTLIIL